MKNRKKILLVTAIAAVIAAFVVFWVVPRLHSQPTAPPEEAPTASKEVPLGRYAPGATIEYNLPEANIELVDNPDWLNMADGEIFGTVPYDSADIGGLYEFVGESATTTYNFQLEVVVWRVNADETNRVLSENRFSKRSDDITKGTYKSFSWDDKARRFLDTVRYDVDGVECFNPLAAQSAAALSFFGDNGVTPAEKWQDLTQTLGDGTTVVESQAGLETVDLITEIVGKAETWVDIDVVPAGWWNHGSSANGAIFASKTAGIGEDAQGRLGYFFYVSELNADGNPADPQKIEEVGEALLLRCLNKAIAAKPTAPTGQTDNKLEAKKPEQGSARNQSNTGEEAGRNQPNDGPGKAEPTPTTPAPAPCAHSFGAWYTAAPAQPGITGWEEHTCSKCGFKEGHEIPALPVPTTPPEPPAVIPTPEPGVGTGKEAGDISAPE